MSTHVILKALQNVTTTCDKLTDAGLSTPAAQAKAQLFRRGADALAAAGISPESGVHALFVPGRVEVLGKHTDYNGGHSLVAAVERGFCVIVHPRTDTTVRLIAVERNETNEFQLHPDLEPTAGHWTNYPMTVARRVARNFPGKLRGVDIAFASDLPPAAGLSSSSALIVAIFLAFDVANNLSQRDEYKQNIHDIYDLAGYLGTNENGQTFGTLVGDKGVGTFGGSQDHTAILCGKANHLCLFGYCPVQFKDAITVPEGYTFAIGSSGVVAEKTGEAMRKYNRASKLGSTVLELWRSATGRKDATLNAAIHSSADAVERMRGILRQSKHDTFSPADLLQRFEHFHVENNDIIPKAVAALKAGDVHAFAQQADRSQHATEHQLRNQVEQTLYLAKTARELDAQGASAFGAGFGGAVWALVRKDKADTFVAEWRKRYEQRYPVEAKIAAFFTTDAGPAAFALK